MKISYRKTFPSKKDQIRICRQLGKLYKIPVYFSSRKEFLGRGYHSILRPGHDRIFIKLTGQDILSTMFHELGHSYCYRNGKWPTYHLCNTEYRNGGFYYSEKDLVGKIRTAYKAECWVDRWARKEMAKYFPNLRYTGGYENNPIARKWLMDNFLYKYKIQLLLLYGK